jgi:hypothetical protein
MASAHEVMAAIAPWTEPLLAYLLRKELPENQTDARRVIRQSKAYKVHEGECRGTQQKTKKFGTASTPRITMEMHTRFDLIVTDS